MLGRIIDNGYEAYITVFSLLHNRAELDLDGDKLVGKALSLSSPILAFGDLNTESGKTVQKGMIQILQGSILTASVIWNSGRLADRRIATRASREGPGKTDDEASPHRRDGVWDVAFGSDRRRLWVDNRR